MYVIKGTVLPTQVSTKKVPNRDLNRDPFFQKQVQIGITKLKNRELLRDYDVVEGITHEGIISGPKQKIMIILIAVECAAGKNFDSKNTSRAGKGYLGDKLKYWRQEILGTFS